MGKIVHLTFASSLLQLCENNSTFDSGVLRVAYHGKNRNRSSISKESFEKAIKSMRNCPVVAHYDRDTDSLGGHDVEVVGDGDGNFDIVNLTQPVGVVPESAKYWWENVEEDDGTIHEYLFTEVLLWKRQEAYKKLKEDGITAHSMEINVNEGHKEDGVFVIDDFEFTAFTLIGVTPCFEQSALELFSLSAFKQQFSEMMQDYKETLINNGSSEEGHNQDNVPGINFEKGDVGTLAEMEFEQIETVEEPEVQAQEIETEPVEEQEPASPEAADDYALNSNLEEEIMTAVRDIETVEYDWGKMSRYFCVDYDIEANEVYVFDSVEDWRLFGFAYSMNGDNVEIDVESKRRKKFVIADFDEGEQLNPLAGVFQMINDNANDAASKYAEATATIESMTEELNSLREFKQTAEYNAKVANIQEVLDKFTVLDGNEAFAKLVEESMNYEPEELEDKCYALLGRTGLVQKFSSNNEASPKIQIQREADPQEPYGGLFLEYGI